MNLVMNISIKNMKFVKRLTHFLIIIILSYIVVRQRSREIINVKRIIRFLPDMRHILLWHKISYFQISGQKDFIKRKCEYTNCYVTTNRSLFGSLGYFDGIIFSAQGVSAGSEDLPKIRNSFQKYIFLSNDSSDNYPVCDPIYDPFFNWTWTYKIDSTIEYSFISIHNKKDEDLGRYFNWIKVMEPIDNQLKQQLTSKTRAAAIFLDKCKSRSQREVYIKNLGVELLKYNLSLDIYGNCGTKTCKRKSMASCFRKLKRQYFFYLAMEDSMATSYVTQEVLYAYENYAVPIVYGGAFYPGILPLHSYLDAMQLNEKMMAHEMNAMIQNRTIYHDYFRWRNHYIIKGNKVIDPCDLCKALNNPYWLTFETKQVAFRKWWNPMYETRCVEK